MAHVHSVYDSDNHFSIDPITRAIINESSTKNTVVQNDHNSERFTFELPRYIEGHDMSVCDRVEVHYLNIEAVTQAISSGVYEVNDLQISPADSKVVICSWLISNNATKYEGITSFLVRFACTTDGDFDYVWNTAVYSDIIVSKGIYNSGIVVENYSDVLAQWHRDLFEAGGNAVVNIKDAEAKAIDALKTAANAKEQEVLNNIPDDYQTLDANVTDYKKKVDGLANAIKGKMSGSVVRADDVSPVEHGVCVCVYSKNLIPYPYYYDSQTKNGVEMTVSEDGTIAFNGTALNDGSFRLIQDSSIPVNGKYTLSGCNGGSNATYYLQPFIDGRGVSALLDGSKVYEWDGNLTSLVFFFKSGAVFENVQFKFQLEKGTTPTEYTPYVDPASVTVTKCGKNILGYAEDFSITQDGLTIEYNADEQIFTINGAPTKASFPINFGSHLFEKFSLPAGINAALSIEYISGTLSAEKTTNVFYLGNSDSPGGGRNNWFSVPFPISGRKTNVATTTRKYFSHTWLYIGGEYDVTFTDYKFKVQLEIGDEPTNYENFSGTKYTPIADGTILDMTSLSPDMTVLTDNSMSIVECEYNRDSNAVIADLYNKIAELSATT